MREPGYMYSVSYEEEYYLDMQDEIVERMKKEQEERNKSQDIQDILKNSKTLFFESMDKKSYFNKIPDETTVYIASFTGTNGCLPSWIADNSAYRGFLEQKIENQKQDKFNKEFDFSGVKPEQTWAEFQASVVKRMKEETNKPRF